MGFFSQLLPIVGIVTPFVSAVILAGLVLLFSYLNKRKKYRVIEMAIEHGRELPPEFFKPVTSSSSSQLRRSLIWIAIGIGSILFFLLEDDIEIAGLATIPFLIGVAYLIVYIVTPKNQSKTSSEQKDAEQV